MTKKFPENAGVFTLKIYQMFSVYTTFEKFQIATFTGPFRFVLEETSGREITRLWRRQLRFQNVSAFSNSSNLKSAFVEELHFVTD